MDYHETIEKHHMNEIAQDCFSAGINGCLIPDIPADEHDYYHQICQFYHLNLIKFISPEHCEKQIKSITKNASGFIYAISSKGKTGTRKTCPSSLGKLVNGIKKYSHLPVALGFGVSSPTQANHYSKWSDGVIVGSAIVKQLEYSTYKTYKFAKDIVRKI